MHEFGLTGIASQSITHQFVVSVGEFASVQNILRPVVWFRNIQFPSSGRIPQQRHEIDLVNQVLAALEPVVAPKTLGLWFVNSSENHVVV